MGSYRYRSLIETLYSLNSPPVVSFKLREAGGCYYDLDLALNSLALQKSAKPSSEVVASLAFRNPGLRGVVSSILGLRVFFGGLEDLRILGSRALEF